VARSFPLPAPWAHQGWKLKIRDRERLEPPHVTILFRTNAWRYGLRRKGFLDRSPDPQDVPSSIVAFIEENLLEIVEAWDELYPLNKVGPEA
jgi:hypothetical protein